MASQALSQPTGYPVKAEATAKSQEQKQKLESRVNDLLEQEKPLHVDGVKSILAYAQFIKAVHDELKGKKIKTIQYDPWTEFKSKCKGGKSTISKCLAIADHPCINDPQYLEVLPNSRASLYELCDLNKAQFKKGVKSGKINTQLADDEAHKLCLELKGIQPAPAGKSLVRGEDKNSKEQLVANQPAQDRSNGAPESEDEDGSENDLAVRTPPAGPQLVKAVAPPNAAGTKEQYNSNSVIYGTPCRCVKFDVREPLRNDLLVLLHKYGVKYASIEINDPVEAN